jgi:ribulose-phosphate 3-epimerase
MLTATFDLGLKTDPIQNRYSFAWLFDLLTSENVRHIQFASFPEMYWLDDSWFVEVRRAAEERGLRVRSVLASHRETGGFFHGDVRFARVARKTHERLIEVAALLGAEYCGSNAGSVWRDRPDNLRSGLECYYSHMEELMAVAHRAGLRALTIEPMSCSVEPPSTPSEISEMMGRFAAHHQAYRESTVPVYLCGDIAHGVCDAERRVLYNHEELFVHGIPWMAEFHLKNTDAIFNATFGFGAADRARGIVDPAGLRRICDRHADRFPVPEVVGYLELPGPKFGRDYSDPLLGPMLTESLRALRQEFLLQCKAE